MRPSGKTYRDSRKGQRQNPGTQQYFREWAKEKNKDKIRRCGKKKRKPKENGRVSMRNYQ